jgi:hypothetical protein
MMNADAAKADISARRVKLMMASWNTILAEQRRARIMATFYSRKADAAIRSRGAGAFSSDESLSDKRTEDGRQTDPCLVDFVY